MFIVCSGVVAGVGSLVLVTKLGSLDDWRADLFIAATFLAAYGSYRVAQECLRRSAAT